MDRLKFFQNNVIILSKLKLFYVNDFKMLRLVVTIQFSERLD